jgi:hypothetical protein
VTEAAGAVSGAGPIGDIMINSIARDRREREASGRRPGNPWDYVQPGAAIQGLWQGFCGALGGIGEAVVNAGDALIHPGRTAKNLGTLFGSLDSDLVGTMQAIGNSIAEAWNRDPSRFMGNVTGNLFLMAAGGSVPAVAAPAAAGPALALAGGGAAAMAAQGIVINVAPIAAGGALAAQAGGIISQMGAPNDGGSAGNLRQMNPAREGIDAESLKADFAFDQAGEFNLHVDANGQVWLVPVRRGTNPNIPTGLTVEEAAQFYPI